MSTGVVIRLKNLPISAGPIDIRRFFGGLSIPDGGVHIIGGEDGTAFILFSTDEDARQAMLRDGQKIVSEKIKLMLSSHTEMRLMIEESQRRYEELRGLRPPEPPITNLTSRSSATGGNVQRNQAIEQAEMTDIYVELKGMPFNVSENDIVEFFKNMPISAIRIMLDDKGRQSGQGYVRFKSHSSKVLALKKDRDFLGPRFVRVLSASDKQWIVAGSQTCETIRPGGENYVTRKRGQNSTPSNEGTPKRSRALSPIRCDNCVELRGLPAASNYKTVQDLFYHLKFVENGLYLEMEGKLCRGRAFAEFATIDDYKEALVKDGEILDGKQIRVINISRQAMVEQIKQHKKYIKVKREEEYKQEREEVERKEHEKRQREAQEKQQAKIYEEQKRKDEEEQRKRREHQLKKQREMEQWLARRHVKEEADRKRILEQRRMEEERASKEAERLAEEKRRQEEEEEFRKKEEMRRDYERKRQLEIDEIELRIKEEEKARLKREILKEELENMNGSVKEVEMDLEEQSPPKDDYAEDYPPPPSDALLPVKPSHSRYAMAPKDSDYSAYTQRPSTTLHSQPSEPPFSSPPPSSIPPYKSMAYQHRFTPPPPLPSAITPGSGPGLPTSAVGPPPASQMPPVAVLHATPPPNIPANLPPPPLPPAIGLNPVIRLPGTPDPPVRVVSEPIFRPPIAAPVKPLQVVPIIVPRPDLPPPRIATVMPPAPVSTQPPQIAPILKSPPGSVYVRLANTLFAISENEIRKFFKSEGLEIPPNGIEFVMKNGKRSGHVFIKFANEDHAAKACEKDKCYLGGRELLVQASNEGQMTQILRKFDTRNFEELFAERNGPPPTSTASKSAHRDDLNLESNIMKENLTCVRLASVPPNATTDLVLKAFAGISVMPNGVRLLRNIDGLCNGSGFVELVTPQDCIRAANLHATAKINGSLIRVMPVKNQDMDREISDHNIKVVGRHSGPLPPPSGHPDDMRPRAPIAPPPMPIPPDVRFPPPGHLPGGLRHPGLREPPRPPVPQRGRSPTPPHMKNRRPTSPSRIPPPMRPRSPPRGPSPMIHRPPTPPMRPRSPMLPPRDITREEIEHRAEMDELNRRIERERAMMRDLHRHGSFDDHPRFPLDGPRFGMDFHPRFSRPPFSGDNPRFPPGPPRFPGDVPPRFMSDRPMRPRFPADLPRYRMPEPVPVKMSNLSFHVTQEDILEFFLKFSPIPDSIRLMYNSVGKLTGEGMIAFTSRDGADAALKELNQHSLLGRKVKLSLA